MKAREKNWFKNFNLSWGFRVMLDNKQNNKRIALE